MLIRVFLHAEFISVIKTVQNPTISMKNAKKKKIEKLIILVISVNFLRFSLKLLSRISEKVRLCFLDGKEDKLRKIRNFHIFENISFIARLQPMIKLEVIMPYQQILQKYDYQGIFACRIHICDKNSSKSYDFHEKCKKKQNN